MDYILPHFEDKGFKVEENSDGVLILSNQYFLVRVLNQEQVIQIADRKDFDRWANSVWREVPLDLEEISYLIDNLSKEPRDVKDLKEGSICNSCAFSFNLRWPKGHVATFWSGPCTQCGENKGCCSTGDYNYKNNRKTKGFRD